MKIEMYLQELGASRVYFECRSEKVKTIPRTTYIHTVRVDEKRIKKITRVTNYSATKAR